MSNLLHNLKVPVGMMDTWDTVLGKTRWHLILLVKEKTRWRTVFTRTRAVVTPWFGVVVRELR